MSEQEPLTHEDLEAMARRAAAASPAPWWAWVEGRDGYGGDNVILIGPRDTDNELPDMYVNHVSAGGSQPAPVEDLDFIANARQDIPRLIAEVRRLREASGRASLRSDADHHVPARDPKARLADHVAQARFIHGNDAVIEIVLDEQWGAFTQALNDALGTRPPRGDDSPPPSTFWIDRTLARITRGEGAPVELSSGNATRITLDGSEVIASSDYEVFEDQRMPLAGFVHLLELWKTEVLDARASAPSVHSDTYHDTYPTCARTYATLRVFSDELDPSAISHLLKVEPTRSHRAGDAAPPEGRRHWPSNGWLLTTDGVVSSLDVRRHVDWLLDAVDETELMALIRERGASVDIFCYWESKSGHGGPELSPTQMWRLARLGLSVGFDVYFPQDS